MTIDAKGNHYKLLNQKIRQSILGGEHEIVLENVNGQRYIGDGLTGDVRIIIKGTPGNDLGAFMNGPTLNIHGNAQDGIGNTMNAGKILVYGHAGDIVGYAMRGGKIFIRGDVGYRVGIHMKAYEGFNPVIIAGGTAQDFLGEYMAGGLIIVLGMDDADPKRTIVGNYCGTGMHAGAIFIRGKVEDYQLGKEVKVFPLNEEDHKTLRTYVDEFAQDFSYDSKEILDGPFCKLIPYTHRPYGKLYAY
jgi:glutamate synthase domain-containing protein 3